MARADRGSAEASGSAQDLFRTTDWAGTSLGDVETWSPVLRTMVDSCLASAFPMQVVWGPECVAIYNDAFASLVGAGHPAGFGRPLRETWGENWGIVGPQVTEVMQHGRTLHADDEQRILYRNGYPEECYFTYSHSPLGDVDGTIAGMLTVATDNTPNVLYERRMRVVRELGGLSVADTANTTEACRAALRVLRTARQTVPFAIAFLGVDDGTLIRVADYGVAEAAAVPGLTDIAVTDPPGAVQRVFAGGDAEEISGLRDAFPQAFEPGPLGPLRPDQAVVIPLAVSGETQPIGAAVLGVNPYRPLNAEYRAFYTLIRRQVRVVLTDAMAYEIERRRAQLLADLDRAKMEFFQNVSHELRTPLTLLVAPLQDLLANSDPRSRRQHADLQAAVRAVQRLRGMVDALLDFSTGGGRHVDAGPTAHRRRRDDR